MPVDIFIVFAVIGALTVLGGVIRVLGVKRISLEFHDQPPSFRKFRRHLEENENPPNQLKE